MSVLVKGLGGVTLVSTCAWMAVISTTATGDSRNLKSERSVGANQSAAFLPLAAMPGSTTNLVTELKPAAPFHYAGAKENLKRAADCLAAAAWYEAGDDPKGQRAVIQVIINRVNHSAFPNSFCGTVFQGSHLATGCQFTFTCDGSIEKRRPSESAKRRAFAISEAALSGSVEASVGNATHYHADYVSPWWSHQLQKLSKVGSHVFYRWHGANGALPPRKNLENEMSFDAWVNKTGPSHSLAGERDDSMTETVYLSAPHTINQTVETVAKTAANSAIFMPLDIETATGRWAMSAMDACAGKPACHVIGYSDAAAADVGVQDPIFVFIRDRVSGMDLALWDCARAPRPNSNQCLPSDRAARERLLRDRSGE
ncbi:hypothetical protein BPTFM16_01552 [Altererythrobacter insulae]|nr:hypothetical protein BPTFM16_01552 [Altererythrobacter insulae]